jgi:hypothetical protein
VSSRVRRSDEPSDNRIAANGEHVGQDRPDVSDLDNGGETLSNSDDVGC